MSTSTTIKRQIQRVEPPQFEGVAPSELGRDCTSLIAHCEYLVQRNYSVVGELCSDDKIVNKTTEPDAMIRRFRLAGQLVAWLLCDEQLIAFKFPRLRDLEMLEHDMQQPLPATWTIERETNGFFLLFKRRHADPEFVANKFIFGGRAKVVGRVPVPGSLHRDSSENYRWRLGRAIDSELASLPPNWCAMLPRVGGLKISNSPVKLPEFDPASVRSRDLDDDIDGYEFDA